MDLATEIKPGPLGHRDGAQEMEKVRWMLRDRDPCEYFACRHCHCLHHKVLGNKYMSDLGVLEGRWT